MNINRSYKTTDNFKRDSRDSSVVAMCWKAGIRLLTDPASRPALWLTHTPFNLVPGAEA
jgi:hypothetical protein